MGKAVRTAWNWMIQALEFLKRDKEEITNCYRWHAC